MRSLRPLALLILLLAGSAMAQSGLGDGPNGERPRMIVILQSPDFAADDAYLRTAETYFKARRQSAERVQKAASLAELHGLLLQRFEAAGPLGEVILVAHGSAWTGAAVDLFAEGPRASLSNMRQAAEEASFPPLPPGAIDKHSVFRLESCAVGRHRQWLRAFAQLWVESASPLPRILASEGFVSFSIAVDGGDLAMQRSEVPVRLRVEPGPAAVDPSTRISLRESSCGDLGQHCEQRSMPIRIAVALDPSASSYPAAVQRRLAQRQARAPLEDLNLRAAQLRWHWSEDGSGTVRQWVGEGTAVVLAAVGGSADGPVMP